MSDRVERHDRLFAKVERKEDIAKAVVKAMNERKQFHLKVWHVVALLAAFLPPYVTMIIALSKLG